MTFLEQLQSIPLPGVWCTDKNWHDSIVPELRQFFIMPKMKYAEFCGWMRDSLGTHSFTEAELRSPVIMRELEIISKGISDRFWLLENNEKSKMFFEYDFQAGDLTSEEYDDGVIIIGYHPESDIFYSNSIFLNNMLSYFRGIDSEELLADSKELYPIQTAFSYANNLDAVLRSYSAFRGIQIIHRILQAEALVIYGRRGKINEFSNTSFFPAFKKIFFSDIHMSSQYHQTEADQKYKLDFFEKDNSRLSLFYGENRLYYGKREYYELQGAASYLTNWLSDIENKPTD